MMKFKLKNLLLAGLAMTVMTGCHWDMWNQDRYEPLEKGDFFGEGETSSRMLVTGVVPYQDARLDTHYYQGRNADETFAAELPADIKLTKELLLRGQNQYDIFCTPCHGYQGLGDGMIVQRGFPAPPSYTDQRLLEMPIGYFFDVMTNGFGRMYSYKTRITVEDRWAIAAYTRALQLSQNATPDLLTQELVDIVSDPEKVDAFNTEALGGSEATHGDSGTTSKEGH
ncbi:MAG: quinol:cytochrome C oxidoreductase [Candidatus Hydrogenedentota bacterium]|nr:MAG: quinol:cytochrome C oxidoreductase [Candidatus Hydrogenedentota bacterium]